MIALSTGSLYTFGTARVFELAAQVGYDGIEVLVDHRPDTRDPAYLRRLSSEHGLPIVVLGGCRRAQDTARAGLQADDLLDVKDEDPGAPDRDGEGRAHWVGVEASVGRGDTHRLLPGVAVLAEERDGRVDLLLGEADEQRCVPCLEEAARAAEFSEAHSALDERLPEVTDVAPVNDGHDQLHTHHL